MTSASSRLVELHLLDLRATLEAQARTLAAADASFRHVQSHHDLPSAVTCARHLDAIAHQQRGVQMVIEDGHVSVRALVGAHMAGATASARSDALRLLQGLPVRNTVGAFLPWPESLASVPVAPQLLLAAGPPSPEKRHRFQVQCPQSSHRVWPEFSVTKLATALGDRALQLHCWVCEYDWEPDAWLRADLLRQIDELRRRTQAA